MRTTRNQLILILAVCASLALTACGPGDDNKKDKGKKDTGTIEEDAGDAMTTTPDGDSGMTSGPDADAGMMPDTEEPDTGVEGECMSAGQTCDPANEPGSGFECVDAGKGPKCMKHCSDQSDCSSVGSLCLPAANTQNAPTVCYNSQCNGPSDLESCSGSNFDGSKHDLFQGASEFKCATLVNDSNLCVPAGQKNAGEACTATSPVQGLFCQQGSTCTACQSGNVCLSGVCKPLCVDNPSNSELECSGQNETCIGANDSNLVSANAGFCDEKCTAYSRGECSDSNEGCTPLDNSKGYCRPTGQKGFMEECTPPDAQNPKRLECKEGMQCLAFQQSSTSRQGIYRCIPICNAPNSMDADPRDNNATCGGTAYGRFAYFGTSPANIDVYVGGSKAVEDLGQNKVSDADSSTMGDQFFDYSPAELDVKVVDGSQSGTMNPIVSEKPWMTSGMVKTWAVTPKGGNMVIQAIDVPRGVSAPAANKAKVRIVHLIPDFMSSGSSVNVDVVAVPASGSLGGGNNIDLAADAAFGDAGSFMEIDGGTNHTIWIFPKGANRSMGNELAKFSGVSVPSGEIMSIYAKGTNGTGRSIAKLSYTDAAPAPDYSCWSSSSNPSPASGLCFQGCDVEDYGKDSCFSDKNGCRPLGANHFCMPEGDKKPGDSCDAGAFQDCEEGAFCKQYGDGSGKCQSYCEAGGSNSVLQCGSNTTCSADQGNFGTCERTCEPGNNFADTDCPPNLQTCIPESKNNGNVEGAYCSASDGKMKGQDCGQGGGTLALQNCQPGQICAYESGTRQSPFQGIFELRDDSNPTCREACNLFESDPGCPQGYACGVDVVQTGSAEAGVCLEKGSGIQQDPEAFTPCGQQNVGKMCGPNSHCILAQGQPVCYRFCDWATKEGCKESANTTCQPFSNGPIGGLGICAPPQ